VHLGAQGFDHIIKGYFKNRPGSRYIERGAYLLLHVENNGQIRTIKPLQLANTVKAGMTLEMGIVLRRETTFHHHKAKCPRCDHINWGTPASDWMEWKVFLFI
jgi:hypothetical protein